MVESTSDDTAETGLVPVACLVQGALVTPPVPLTHRRLMSHPRRGQIVESEAGLARICYKWGSFLLNKRHKIYIAA